VLCLSQRGSSDGRAGHGEPHFIVRDTASLAVVPWPAIVGMRNQLVHGCWSIDPDELWLTIQRDIPALVHQLKGRAPESVAHGG
jgi:hypothetical protein